MPRRKKDIVKGTSLQGNELDTLCVLTKSVEPFIPQRSVTSDPDDESFIKKCVSQTYSTVEYGEFISYLRKEHGMSACSYNKDINSNSISKVEIHHSPFTLFEIVRAVTAKHIEKEGIARTFSVINEVVELHYRGKIGLIPLSPTMHNLSHSGYIPFDIRHVFGNWKEFIEEYKEYFSIDMKEKCSEIENLTEENFKMGNEFRLRLTVFDNDIKE